MRLNPSWKSAGSRWWQKIRLPILGVGRCTSILFREMSVPSNFFPRSSWYTDFSNKTQPPQFSSCPFGISHLEPFRTFSYIFFFQIPRKLTTTLGTFDSVRPLWKMFQAVQPMNSDVLESLGAKKKSDRLHLHGEYTTNPCWGEKNKRFFDVQIHIVACGLSKSN